MLPSMRSPRLSHRNTATSTINTISCSQQQHYSAGHSCARRCLAPCRAVGVANRSGEWTQVLELLNKAPVTPLPSAASSDSDDAADIPPSPLDRARLTRSLHAASPASAIHNSNTGSSPHAPSSSARSMQAGTADSSPAGPASSMQAGSSASSSPTFSSPSSTSVSSPASTPCPRTPQAANVVTASVSVSAAASITSRSASFSSTSSSGAPASATTEARRLVHTQQRLSQQAQAQQQVLQPQQQSKHAETFQRSQHRLSPEQLMLRDKRQVALQAEALAASYSQAMAAVAAPAMQRPRTLQLAACVHGMASVKGPLKSELQDRLVSHTSFGPGPGVWDAYNCGPHASPFTLTNSSGNNSSYGGKTSTTGLSNGGAPAHAPATSLPAPGPSSSVPLPLAAAATAAALASFSRPSSTSPSPASPQPAPLISFAAVFDGHSGCRTAETAAARMPQLIAHDPLIWEALGQGSGLRSWDGDGACEAQAVSQRWNRIFHGLDSEILTASREEAWLDGSTAMAMLQVGRKLFVANAGDCRAVLCRQGEPLRMSRDHTPQLPSERSRIEGNGGRIALIRGVWRVALPSPNGKGAKVCAVARGLGDRDFKEKGLISADPEVMATLLQPGSDAFLIIASDGVWGVVDDFDAVDAVKGVVRQFASLGADKQTVATAAAQAVVKLAQEAGSMDDISALVVLYDWK